MSRVPRRLFAAGVAIGTGLAAGLAAFALTDGGAMQREDIRGASSVLLGGGLLTVFLLHYPALAWLERRGRLPVRQHEAVLAALVINLPLYLILLLAHVNGGIFAPGEAMLLGGAFTAMAIAFGLLFRARA